MATPGPTTFSGTIAAGGSTNPIASFSKIQIVQANNSNAITFTANPVVQSVTVALAAPTTFNTLPATNAGAAANIAVSVNAMDAGGNIIAGNTPYVDAAGNPVSFSLLVSNTQAGGSGTVTIQGPSRILAPSSAAITAHYDGKWLQSSTISVTSSSPLITSLTPATLATKPTIYEYPLSAAPGSLTTGPDGNIWFTEPSTNALIKMSLSGVVLNTYTNASSYSGAFALTVGPDGNFWAAESVASNNIAKVSVNGAVLAEYTVPSANATVSAITTGPDGNIWFTEYNTNNVGKLSVNGAFKEYGVSAAPEGITVGPDDRLWVASYSSSNLRAISTAGVLSAAVSIPAHGTGVVTGNDGNVWFTTATGSYVGYVVPSTGAVSTFNTGGTTRGIINGPDGNIWYADQAGHKIGTALINCSSSCRTEYGSPTTMPYQLTLGSDGNIWFTETGSYIGKFVL